MNGVMRQKSNSDSFGFKSNFLVRISIFTMKMDMYDKILRVIMKKLDH